MKLLVLIPAFAAAFPAVAGTFTSQAVTGDADSGISSSNAYTAAIDVFDTANRTINGAVFTGSGGGANPATSAYSTGSLPNGFNNFNSGIGGSVGGLFNNFLYGGNPETVTVNNLRVGQQYTTSFFGAAFGPAGGRITTVAASDGGSIVYDQNSQPGSTLNYTFTATSNAMTFSFTPSNPGDTWHQYAFSNKIDGYKALLTDNFYAPSNPNTFDLNFNLAARQGGALVTTSGTIPWVAVNNTQVGNSTGGIDNGNYLLNAFGNGISALDYNFNGTSSTGGLSVSFDVAPNSVANGDSTVWEGINIGQSSADKNGGINGPHTHFGILFRGNGQIQAFDGNADVTGATTLWSATSHTSDLTRIELLFSDSTDGNPFDGVGQTKVDVFAAGAPVYSFTKTGGGYANNYINFSSTFIGGVDNLMIAQVPEPAVAGLFLLGGLAIRHRRIQP